jgi:AmpD protein
VTEFSIKEGWLTPARRLQSPNSDERPADGAVDLLVIHGISLPPGEFGGPWIDALFCNAIDSAAHPYFQEITGLEVSAHVLIRRDGEVVQYVPFDRRAWHAGQSCFEGRERCNDFSIGIELEGSDDLPYEPVQYQVLADVCRALLKAFPAINATRIVGHCDIAPGRKTDPGPHFDWPRLRALISA